MLHGLIEEIKDMNEVFSCGQLFFRLCALNELTQHDPLIADLSLSIIPLMKRMALSLAYFFLPALSLAALVLSSTAAICASRSLILAIRSFTPASSAGFFTFALFMRE